MTNTGYLMSSIGLGLLTIGVIVLLGRVRKWRSYSPQIGAGQYGRGGEAKSVRLPLVGSTNAWSIAAIVYVLAVFAVLTLTIGTLDESIGGEILLTSLAIIIGGYLLYGVCFSSGIPRFLKRAGYRLQRTVSFRRRPLWSMLLGYATFLAVLLTTAIVVLGLWIAGSGSVGFLIALCVLGLVVALYVTSHTGVSVIPSSHGGGARTTLATVRGSPGSISGESSAGEGRFDPGRVRPVLRGWLTIATLLVVGAAGAIALWHLGRGPIGFLAGLVVVIALAVGYAVAGTW